MHGSRRRHVVSGQVNETGELVFGDVVGPSDAAESEVEAGAVDGVEAPDR
ncbi:hypothetical protein ABZX65_22425 [Streptomyces sp. NPDC003300]